MIGMLKKRKLRKQLKDYFHAARHARNMREDIADPKDLEALATAEATLRVVASTEKGDLEKSIRDLEVATNAVYPSRHRSGVRENVEVIIVALGAAMAIRAFFFQPFKIPTGSMQPTLNGITVQAQASPGLFDNALLKFPKWLVTGASYKEIRAKATGSVAENARFERDYLLIEIGGVPHKIPAYMRREISLNRFYNKGDVIVGARVIAGDHILVNKMKYNFMKPERGDISVFDTKHIVHSGVRKDTFYIKRMVGLSGEKIQIQNRRIVADGAVVNDPPMFNKIATDPIYSGGHAPTAGSLLENEEDYIQLADDEYLMMGDNTRPSMSLDGRYFGGVERDDFQGPAFFVYWPFRGHWGWVK